MDLIVVSILMIVAPGSSQPSSANAVDAAEIYAHKCDVCHGENGKAQTTLGEKYDIPDFTTEQWRSKWPVKRIAKITRNGRPDTKMDAFADELSAEEIDAVANYVRRLGG